MKDSLNGNRQHKERLYGLFAQVASAMANAHRLELLDLLTQAPRTVEELAREAQMSIANTSQHLQRLKQARLVVGERDGLYSRYRLAHPGVADLWVSIRQMAEQQLADVAWALDAYRQDRSQFEAISADELQARLRRDQAILLDVRPSAEYRADHLPGAISVPLDALEKRLSEFPRDKTIVAYCRGPYCAYADQALSLLAAEGHKVARLEEGVVEWRHAGYPLET